MTRKHGNAIVVASSSSSSSSSSISSSSSCWRARVPVSISAALAAMALWATGLWSTLVWIGLTVTATPAVALLQAIVALIRYRLYFLDAPIPKTPSHGAVIDGNATSSTVPSSSSSPSSPLSCPCCTRQRPPHYQQQQQQVARDERIISLEDADPLRLLVLGDSLAIGVGQSQSCCPVMAETIAKSLYRYFGGHRPVFWTCHGAPGASAGWIVRELAQRLPGKAAADMKPLVLQRTMTGTTEEVCSDATTSTSSSISSEEAGDDELGDACTSSNATAANDASDSQRKMTFEMQCSFDPPQQQPSSTAREDESRVWRERLSEHSRCLENNPVDGHYDIVVVLTGSNDLKGALFPFLLTGDDVEFHKQAQERGGSYTRELCRVLQVLEPRLRRRRLQQPEQAHPYGCSDATLNTSSNATVPNPHLPLVVLPGMPARALPIFRPLPLRWAAGPIVDCMDRHKEDLATSRPNDVLYVPPPTVEDICSYEIGQGPIWASRLLEANEPNMSLLRDVTLDECARIRLDMGCYFGDTQPLLPLSQRSGPPGTRIFSPDRIHPNEDGYDFWGRHIANAIVQQWQGESCNHANNIKDNDTTNNDYMLPQEDDLQSFL